MASINERLAKISSKLGEINIQKECSKAHRIDSLSNKLQNLEDAFQNELHSQQRRIQLLKDEIAKVAKQLEVETSQFDQY